MKTNVHKTMLSNYALSAFCMEVSLLIQAGMPLDQGILSLLEDEKSKEGKQIFTTIYQSMEEGSTFHDALCETGVFPTYMTDMVLVGEKTGEIEKILEQLHFYYQKEEQLHQSIKSAVIYPMIMVFMMFIVLMVLVLKILPMFNEVYYELGSEVPVVATMIMQIGMIVSKAAVFVFGVACILAVAAFFYGKRHPDKKLFSLEKTFFAKGKTSLMIAQSRFTSVLALALSSGLEIEYAMELALKLINHEGAKQQIRQCRDYLEQGESFSDAIEKTGIIKGVYAGLLNIGFKTGNADKVMKELSQRYSQQVDNRINSVVSSIEPTLVIILSILVGVILLLVMMPLMGIMSPIG